ncbi:endonuclease Q family protein [Pontibacillus salicampi]|uniref:Endonuclease Q family protein n=1 Tax=Pontibacillus salicampi TaxID=1449801 RepID=A0ABV6LKZ0_9BACI
MDTFFLDLHIHIGRTMYGAPVKITASDSLTLEGVVEEASERKGIDVVGVIDCHVPDVQSQILQWIQSGTAEELEQGGIRYKGTTLLPGVEIEVYDDRCKGPIHVLCYFPTITSIQQFTRWMSHYVTNITLSTQRFYGSGMTLQKQVRELGGLFVPAHMFTPFKSLYGKGVHSSLSEVFHPDWIDAVELGLSADSRMADQLTELHQYTYLTNSDAHSLPKIAREYQQAYLNGASFEEVRLAFHREAGRSIVANYGMNPRLGKYYETTCKACGTVWGKGDRCHRCDSSHYIKGVKERVDELSTDDSTVESPERPPYVPQVPLQFLPKLGPKTLEKLLYHFGTEMNVIHHVPEHTLANIIPKTLAKTIIANREGKMTIEAGGGGRYGRVKG